jgi:hypothetical protein
MNYYLDGTTTTAPEFTVISYEEAMKENVDASAE